MLGALNNSQLVVVLIGRHICVLMRIARWHFRYKICTLRSLFLSTSRPDKVKVPHSFTLLHSHHWILYIGDSHLKQTPDYRQVRKSLPGVSQPKRSKTTTNGTCSWQFRCINLIHIVLCTSNGLIYVYIVGICVKRITTSCFRDICCNQSEFSDYYLVSYMLIIFQ